MPERTQRTVAEDDEAMSDYSAFQPRAIAAWSREYERDNRKQARVVVDSSIPDQYCVYGDDEVRVSIAGLAELHKFAMDQEKLLGLQFTDRELGARGKLW